MGRPGGDEIKMKGREVRVEEAGGDGGRIVNAGRAGENRAEKKTAGRGAFKQQESVGGCVYD